MAATGIAGAIASTRSEKPLGQLDTCIGWSHLWASATLPAGMELNEQPTEYHIGPASADAIDDIPTTGKGLKLLQASGAVAIDGVVSTGWLNKTGRALATGEYVMAVQA